MKHRAILILSPVLLLAACGEPAAEPVAEEAPSVEEQIASIETIPAPDQQVFSATYAATCPDAEPVNTAVCKRMGIGSDDVLCEYGLGDDEYLRNKATLTPQDEEWTIVDPETVCAAGA